MVTKVYAVTCGRGVIEVEVTDAVITMRGEKRAVLDAAWRKLLGQNDLGEVVRKKVPTRSFLIAEIKSRHTMWDEPAEEIFWRKASYRIKAINH